MISGYIPGGVREPSIVEFNRFPPHRRESTRHWYARTQNAVVEWVECDDAPASFTTAGIDETLLLIPDSSGLVHWESEDFAFPAGACCVVAVLAMRDTCDFSLQEVGCRTYSILHFAIALVAGLELPFGMVLFIIGSSGYCCGKENGKQRCQKA